MSHRTLGVERTGTHMEESGGRNSVTLWHFQEDVIAVRMQLGQLLVRANLITVEQMNDALERQAGQGGRFGDHLVAAGHMSQEALDAFIHKTPVEPEILRQPESTRTSC